MKYTSDKPFYYLIYNYDNCCYLTKNKHAIWSTDLRKARLFSCINHAKNHLNKHNERYASIDYTIRGVYKMVIKDVEEFEAFKEDVLIINSLTRDF